MSLFEDVVEASRLFSRAEESFFGDYFPEGLTDEELARLWLVADEWRKTVDGLVKLVADEWVARGVWVEVDGFKVGYKKGSTSDKCIDEEGFWAVVLENPEKVRDYFNPNSVRVGQIPPAVRDTFFERVRTMKPDAVEQPTAIPLQVLEDMK